MNRAIVDRKWSFSSQSNKRYTSVRNTYFKAIKIAKKDH